MKQEKPKVQTITGMANEMLKVVTTSKANNMALKKVFEDNLKGKNTLTVAHFKEISHSVKKNVNDFNDLVFKAKKL